MPTRSKYYRRIGDFLKELHLQESTQLEQESTQSISAKLPEALRIQLENLGTHPKKEHLRRLIIHLCALQPLSAAELAEILGKKSKKALVDRFMKTLAQMHLDFFACCNRQKHGIHGYVDLFLAVVRHEKRRMQMCKGFYETVY